MILFSKKNATQLNSSRKPTMFVDESQPLQYLIHHVSDDWLGEKLISVKKQDKNTIKKNNVLSEHMCFFILSNTSWTHEKRPIKSKY